jgi:DnaJ family protein C protein 7
VDKFEEAVADCMSAYDLLEKLAFPGVDSETISNEDRGVCPQAAMFLKIVLRRADCFNKLEKFDESVRDYTLADGLQSGQNNDVRQALSDAKKAQKMAKRKNYYKILGIDKNADEKDITRGYRKMCLKYHPDRHASVSDEEKEVAIEQFKEVGEAYAVLNDSRKKHMYDSGMDIDGTSASDGGGGHHHHGGGGNIAWVC